MFRRARVRTIASGKRITYVAVASTYARQGSSIETPTVPPYHCSSAGTLLVASTGPPYLATARVWPPATSCSIRQISSSSSWPCADDITACDERGGGNVGRPAAGVGPASVRNSSLAPVRSTDSVDAYGGAHAFGQSAPAMSRRTRCPGSKTHDVTSSSNATSYVS